MKEQVELASWTAGLIVKSVVITAKWAIVTRFRAHSELTDEKSKEILKENILLRQKVAELDGLMSILRSQLKGDTPPTGPTAKQRLFVLWHMEFFRIPRRRVKEYYGIACSAIYRWLQRIHSAAGGAEAADKTPAEIGRLVWKIAITNPTWGRLRVAWQMALLGIIICSSTVQNILNRPQPANAGVKPEAPEAQTETKSEKQIPAERPNHVWSADLATVRTWLFCRTDVLAAIDHFSRKLLALVPLKRADAASVIAALESAFQLHGCPKHLVTDEGPVFTGPVFGGFLVQHSIKPRTGAVGKHGSISITERVTESFKYEWLRRVPLIRGFDHLTELCSFFVVWMNEWRPHQGIAGARPEDVYRSSALPPPVAAIERSRMKRVPSKIESIHFTETRTTAWRLPRAA